MHQETELQAFEITLTNRRTFIVPKGFNLYTTGPDDHDDVRMNIMDYLAEGLQEGVIAFTAKEVEQIAPDPEDPMDCTDVDEEDE